MVEHQQPVTTKSTRLHLSDSQINSIAGATSGLFVSVLVSPLDVVKTRIQVKRLPKGVPDTPMHVVMYRLAQREGIGAFYKGVGPTMLVEHIDLFSRIRSVRLSFRDMYLIGRCILPLINGRGNGSGRICRRLDMKMIF